MQTYRGRCHCGAVTFEFESDLTYVSQCNCSICTRKGSITHRVPTERFRLLAGEEALTLYQFNKKIAKHRFCKICGIHPFHEPRSHPGMISVNVRCLENFDFEDPALERRFFDGQNWEQAAKNVARD